MNDPHAEQRDRALASVLDGPGQSDPGLRKAAAANQQVPQDLQALVAKVHAHAYRVTDEDVTAAKVKYGDDRMFEVIVSAAMGASKQRLDAGLRALDEA
jgi:predicted RNA polymerase sigma factor